MTDLVKKVMCVGAAGMLALGLVACSDSEKKPSSGGTHVAATALPSTANLLLIRVLVALRLYLCYCYSGRSPHGYGSWQW